MRYLACLFLVAFLATPIFAQNQPNNDANDPDSQLRDMRRQVFQNMMNKGMDPRQFFQDIRQQMQDGTFDPAQLQKTLIEKGVLDQATADKMQMLAQSSTYTRIKQQLDASDEEWKVIQPKVQKVLTALADVAPPTEGGGMRMLLGGSAGSSAVLKATRELRAAVNDPKTSPQTMELRIRAWRDAHDKAQADLNAAQKDLVSVLTTRQEATLSMMGLIP